jgi:short-subunit dehydrogenase
MQNLKNRNAVVTGAARGIGEKIAHALAKKGMNIVLVDRLENELEQVRAALAGKGVKVVSLVADIGTYEACTEVLEQSEKELGGIDVLVNNAGLEIMSAYEASAWEAHCDVMNINLNSPMMLTHLFLPGMLKRNRGHIVNIASMAGLVGVSCLEAYCASKHGLIGFTRSLRASNKFSGSSVGVSAICPGYVRGSGMVAKAMDGEYGKAAIPGKIQGSVAVDKVAAGVVKVIRSNKQFVVVNPGAPRVIMAFGVLFPSFGEWVFRAIGAHNTTAAMAKEHGLGRKLGIAK